MTSITEGTEILDEAQCWDLLKSTSVGRLAVDVAGRPDIFPINYVVDGRSLVFRSGAGTKLAASVLLHHVAFEIDGYEPDGRTVWSVVVKGDARHIESMDEVFSVDDLPLFPWLAFPKPNYVRIEPELVTGRRFHVVDEVAPDSSIGWNAVDGDDEAVLPAPETEYHPGSPLLRPD